MLTTTMMKRATVVAVATRRALSTEAKAAEKVVAPPAAKKTKSGSSIGQRVVAFTVGFGLAGGMGLLQLSDDVEASTYEIQTAISALKSDVIAQNEALTKRVEQLEARK